MFCGIQRKNKEILGVEKAINQRDLRNIVDISQKNPGPASRIIMRYKKISEWVPREAKEAMEASYAGVPHFEKRLGVLSTIAVLPHYWDCLERLLE